MSMESIGEKLKRVRQEKGLSIEEVQKKTKIHPNILKSIEGDTLTNLSPIYLKGFIKIYCHFLGVEFKDCASGHKETVVPAVKEYKQNPEDKPMKSANFMENTNFKLRSLRPNKNLKRIIYLLLGALILIFIVSNIVRFISSRLKKTSNVAMQVNMQKPEIKTNAKSSFGAQPFGAKLPKESSGGISLVISTREKCLVFVKVDGRVVLHRVLEKGRSDSWKAKEKIELSLSNAAAVELIVNGQRFTKLGRKGQQLKNIVITEKDGLRILK